MNHFSLEKDIEKIVSDSLAVLPFGDPICVRDSHRIDRDNARRFAYGGAYQRAAGHTTASLPDGIANH